MGIEKSVVVLKRIYKLWFTNKEQDMSKCELTICGAKFVGDTADVLKVFEAINTTNLERIEYDYITRADSPTGESQTLYYTKPIGDGVKVESLNSEDYAMWKLYTASRGEKK
jgi:hypothetical protein